MTERRKETLVIIGSGPAAWTASVYAARANLDPLVYEGEPMGTAIPGGQLMTTTEVENYPGFEEGISGPELMDRMRQQALRFGTRVMSEAIERVDFSATPFRLTPTQSAEVDAMAVIVVVPPVVVIVPAERLMLSAAGCVTVIVFEPDAPAASVTV